MYISSSKDLKNYDLRVGDTLNIKIKDTVYQGTVGNTYCHFYAETNRIILNELLKHNYISDIRTFVLKYYYYTNNNGFPEYSDLKDLTKMIKDIYLLLEGELLESTYEIF